MNSVFALVLEAVRGMRAALEELMLPGGPSAGGLAGAPPPGPGAAAPGAPAAASLASASPAGGGSLAAELRALLELLALRPLAATALGLPRPPAARPPQPPPAEGKEAGGGGGGQAATAPSAVPAAGAGLELTSGGASARAALDAARRAAALAGPLVPLPPSARMPSSFQRHWLRYAAAAGAAGYLGLFLLRHSRLAGSDDLDRWILAAATAVRSALATHVVAPLVAVRDELFRTFRDRPAIVSPEEFAAARESLVRMLDAFAVDHDRHRHAHKPQPPLPPAPRLPQPAAAPAGSAAAEQGSGGDGGAVGGAGSDAVGGGGGGEAAAEAAVAAGMAVLMGCYEEELKRPLRNALLGDLARALLIQVHHVKVDGQAAMLRLDQLLRANELTAALVAALPALAISLAAGAGLVRLLSPRAPDPRREAVPSRLAMAALERELSQLARQEAAGANAALEATAAVEQRGMVLYRLYQVFTEVSRLYTPAARRSRVSEWRPLAADLVRLAEPRPASERLAEHQRIMRTYSVFQR
ncbi:hypothetical protein GPECTOR_11g280 [Gonium pectorale]|uniref:Uncharacterized protein n=1 Tax=Gonium pectorale TaxID=33097 RepID=A0A150GQ28_GONPE|nr:hypothetical protein GPECTOR_11g280 [Gonium pectorale]|eukprot:KXZ51842.1 hypothetical protein GPECTOR_11g280 [Gonium pectorale]